MQIHLHVNSPSPGMNDLLFLGGGGMEVGEAPLAKGNFSPAVKHIRGRQGALPLSVGFQLLSPQNNSCAKVTYFGVVYSEPLQYSPCMQRHSENFRKKRKKKWAIGSTLRSFT